MGGYRRTPPAIRRLEDRLIPRGGAARLPVGCARVCVIAGTRPEVIKMAPVISALRARPEHFETIVVTTAQHREMLAQALDAFGLTPQVDLSLMSTRQSLADFTSRALLALSSCFGELRPDIVLVQGDTTTVLAASLAAYYLGIAVGHVEAGLRSGNLRNPFPEELNRRMAGAVAELHFAPTARARDNLIHEGVPGDRVFITGNTIVDALMQMPRRERFESDVLDGVPWHEQVVLVTVHRRENIGEPLHEICAAIREIVLLHPRVHVVFPVHLNPRVRDIVMPELASSERVLLTDPLSYGDLLEAVRRSVFVMTDSGGIQEECPSLRKPVLVLRQNTERPEVVTSGFGRVVGTDSPAIVATADRLLRYPDELRAMTTGENPFGRGDAGERIAMVLQAHMTSRAAASGQRSGGTASA